VGRNRSDPPNDVVPPGFRIATSGLAEDEVNKLRAVAAYGRQMHWANSERLLLEDGG
jgi:hypothetical protein